MFSGSGQFDCSPSSAVSVSYTHLDVYKRQVKHCSDGQRTHQFLFPWVQTTKVLSMLRNQDFSFSGVFFKISA